MRKITLLIFIVGFAFHSYGQNLLNQQFEASRGKWEVPLKKYTSVFDNKRNERYSGDPSASPLTIITDSSYVVNALHAGEVILIAEIETLIFVVVVKYGDYYIAYNPLKKLTVKKGDQIYAGDTIGLLSPDIDSNFNLDIYLSFKLKDLCAKNWINWNPKTKTIEACATTSEYVYQKSN